ncbi:unnamed protein product, partial [Prorocentrum cordatum]
RNREQRPDHGARPLWGRMVSLRPGAAAPARQATLGAAGRAAAVCPAVPHVGPEPRELHENRLRGHVHGQGQAQDRGLVHREPVQELEPELDPDPGAPQGLRGGRRVQQDDGQQQHPMPRLQQLEAAALWPGQGLHHVGRRDGQHLLHRASRRHPDAVALLHRGAVRLRAGALQRGPRGLRGERASVVCLAPVAGPARGGGAAAPDHRELIPGREQARSRLQLDRPAQSQGGRHEGAPDHAVGKPQAPAALAPLARPRGAAHDLLLQGAQRLAPRLRRRRQARGRVRGVPGHHALGGLVQAAGPPRRHQRQRRRRHLVLSASRARAPVRALPRPI